jgi:hypothetical protein
MKAARENRRRQQENLADTQGPAQKGESPGRNENKVALEWAIWRKSCP